MQGPAYKTAKPTAATAAAPQAARMKGSRNRTTAGGCHQIMPVHSSDIRRVASQLLNSIDQNVSAVETRRKIRAGHGLSNK